jgi:hypothetical protein
MITTMKPKKYPVDELLRLACVHAEASIETGIQCCLTQEQADAEENLLRQLRAYRIKRWGRTKLDEHFDGATETPVVAGGLS